MMWRHEIDLKDMLSDPIVQAVMRADGIDRGEFDDLLTRVARARRDRRIRPAPPPRQGRMPAG
jgi:hypothetical protein